MKTFQNFVNGEFVDSVDGATTEVINPATGAVYATAPISGAADIDRAMRGGRRGVPGVARRDAERTVVGADPHRRRGRGAAPRS